MNNDTKNINNDTKKRKNIFLYIIIFSLLIYYLFQKNSVNNSYVDNKDKNEIINKFEKIFDDIRDKKNIKEKLSSDKQTKEEEEILFYYNYLKENISKLEQAIQYDINNKKFIEYILSLKLSDTDVEIKIDNNIFNIKSLNNFYNFLDKQINYFQKQLNIFRKKMLYLENKQICKDEDEDNQNKIFFKDIFGLDQAKNELEDLIYFFQDKNDLVNVEKIQPKGYLLYGPPGTGKTFLIKAFCNEAKVHFIEIDPSIFDRKYVGEGAEILDKIWKDAESHKKSIIFIDEINGFTNRENIADNKVSINIINSLLLKLDGYKKSNKKIVVMGATNFLNQVDAALLSRFSQKIYIGLLENEKIKNFFEHIITPYSISYYSFVFLDKLAERCKNKNYSNRELKDIIESAYKKTAKYKFKNPEHETMLPSDLEEVIDSKQNVKKELKEIDEIRKKCEEEYLVWNTKLKDYLKNTQNNNQI
ncbi:MAG: ATP-dependent Zn protease [Candidatus Phytoplasma cynodontis]|uniref:AAA family ATPase n=1 Tax='Cynodon dactylon' phytoplasma TaxID=295320 RepID=UPI001265B307|nr:ATP-binding protein ['Cynodon dactylon' phytoplasma]KAB8121733.1 AAA family ATPase ['Cynodon dactylon' phytoplasma]WIA07682.1 MAG: ATP-dependent Zn protease [Candidatus Phytoplasma cynodontis]